MPYEEQATNWTEEFRERFFGLHAQADNVEIINPHYHDDCYEETDQFMIDDSDLLLIVGDDTDKLSSVDYAKKAGVKMCLVRNLYNNNAI